MARRYDLNKNKFLSDEEYAQLVRFITPRLSTDRNALMIMLALNTGARAQELLNLTKDCIDHSRKAIFIEGLKDSKDRELPLKADLYRALVKYAQTVEGERLFPITYDRLYQIWNEYRPCKKGIHSLRHTFAMRTYLKTRDLNVVQAALGHRNIQNTMVYAEYAYTAQELRKII